jgi:serine/threonine protein kinase
MDKGKQEQIVHDSEGIKLIPLLAKDKDKEVKEAVALLNDRIAAYNDSLNGEDLTPSITLLQEIIFHTQSLIATVDPKCQSVRTWLANSNLYQQFISHQMRYSTGIIADLNFYNFAQEHGYGKKLLPDIKFDKHHKIKSQFKTANRILSKLKNKKSLDSIFEDQIALYHCLKKLNFFILSKLSKISLHEKNILKNYRKLLAHVNGHLARLIAENSKLSDKYNQHIQIYEQFYFLLDINNKPETLARTLAILHKKSLVEENKKENATYKIMETNSRKRLNNLIPILEPCKISLIPGSNNTIWLITNPLFTTNQVITVISNPRNTQAIRQLLATAVADYICPRYITLHGTGTTSNDYHHLIVTDYLPLGNLAGYSARQYLKNTVVEHQHHALQIMIKLVRLPLLLEQEDAYNSDMKPSNVLVFKNNTGEYEVKINDVKGFKLAKDGGCKKVNRSEYMSDISPVYTAPEIMNSKPNQEVDTEKAASYQIGIALYAYLTGQGANAEWAWLYQETKVIDFDFPIFQGGVGKELQVLCLDLLSGNPTKRLSLAATLRRFEKILWNLQSYLADAVAYPFASERSLLLDFASKAIEVKKPDLRMLIIYLQHILVALKLNSAGEKNLRNDLLILFPKLASSIKTDNFQEVTTQLTVMLGIIEDIKKDISETSSSGPGFTPMALQHPFKPLMDQLKHHRLYQELQQTIVQSSELETNEIPKAEESSPRPGPSMSYV